jgi:hypothetical protein
MAHLAHGQNHGPIGTQANRVIIFTTPPLPADTSLISKKKDTSPVPNRHEECVTTIFISFLNILILYRFYLLL